MKKIFVLSILFVAFFTSSYRFLDQAKDNQTIYSYSFKIMNPDDFEQKKDLDVAVDKIFEGTTKSKVIDFNSRVKKYEVFSIKKMNQKQIESSFSKLKIIISDLRIGFLSNLTTK